MLLELIKDLYLDNVDDMRITINNPDIYTYCTPKLIFQVYNNMIRVLNVRSDNNDNVIKSKEEFKRYFDCVTYITLKSMCFYEDAYTFESISGVSNMSDDVYIILDKFEGKIMESYLSWEFRTLTMCDIFMMNQEITIDDTAGMLLYIFNSFDNGESTEKSYNKYMSSRDFYIDNARNMELC